MQVLTTALPPSSPQVILADMSPELKADVMAHLLARSVSQIPFFFVPVLGASEPAPPDTAFQMAIYPLLKPVVREAKEVIISRGDSISDLTFVHKGTVHAYGHWNAARQLRPPHIRQPEWAGSHPILGSGSALRTTRRVIGPRTARVLAEEEELALKTAPSFGRPLLSLTESGALLSEGALTEAPTNMTNLTYMAELRTELVLMARSDLLRVLDDFPHARYEIGAFIKAEMLERLKMTYFSLRFQVTKLC